MTNIDFFKKQAKRLLKDWRQREQNHFGFNVKELFRLYDIKPNESPTLMKAQHLLAKSLGRKNWDELINASEEELEYAKNSFLSSIQEEKRLATLFESYSPKISEETIDTYHGMVECLHCGQKFPIDKPNHLPSCDGEDWDLVPIDKLEIKK